LSSNSKTRLERFTKGKPFSLLGLVISDEGKKFYNIDTWTVHLVDTDIVVDGTNAEEHAAGGKGGADHLSLTGTDFFVKPGVKVIQNVKFRHIGSVRSKHDPTLAKPKDVLPKDKDFSSKADNVSPKTFHQKMFH
jgi:hypothetical protein